MAKRNLPYGGHVPMEPGERDTPVTIEQRPATDGRGASGFPVDAWTTLAARVWMRRLDLKGAERFAAEQASARLETQWEMGYRADMDPEQLDVTKLRRLRYQGRYYDIVSASLIGRRAGIELLTVKSSVAG